MSRRYWEWSAPFQIIPEETALLIVDMQKGFVHPDGALYGAEAAAHVPPLAELKKFCNERGIPVYLTAFVQDVDYHHDYYWFRNEERGLLNEDGTCKFKVGTFDGELADEFLPLTDGDTYLMKYTYSCFAHTELETMLKKQRIRTVVCRNVQTGV